MNDSPTVTLLLERVRAGDGAASAALFDLLYQELRGRAHRILDAQQAGATLQPTMLVHEAWLKLVPDRDAAWNDRSHFLRAAAAAMRSVLVDHARARRTQKRGGDRSRVELDALCSAFEDRAVDLEGLDGALAQLAELDDQLAQVVELRFFGGLSIAETARVLDVSPSTVERAWRMARTWLRAALEES